MPRPTGYTDTWSASLTGSAPVNSLIGGTKWESVKWSDPTAVTSLTYSFMTPGVSYFAINYSSKNEYLDSYSLTAAQQTAVSNALDSWSSVANILFSKTSDNIVNVGDLRFGGYASMDEKTAAWAYLPDETPKGGDVWIGPETNSLSPVKGSYDYLTFMHEIGHAIGLKHPFSASALNPTVIDPSVDDVRYTIMSYNDSYSYQPTTPMLLDILAIQNLYGANTHWQAGNTTYSWAPTQSVFETIWDSGGIDTIDGSNQLAGVKINLNEGQFSNIGKSFLDLNTLTAINNGLTIAWGTKIENAVGSAFDDVLTGNALDNLLVGNEGADTMIGGAGNDTYYVDNVGDVVVETSTLASEIDTVNSSIDYTLGANVENLNLIGGANLNATGNELGNRITGNSGNNIIDGGAGADYMAGGTGNDTYIVDNVGDYVVETSTIASEIDTVRSSVSFTLGANIENLTLTGTANIDGIGNSLNNVLIGNDGNNQLNGGAGLDTMIGGKGDDAYGIDQAGELALVQENANEGNDTLAIVYTATAQNNVIDLNLSNLQNVENVSLYAAGAFTVLGNALDNVLIGNADANTLQGGAGNDVLNGGAGADALIGGTGDDTYIVDNVGDTVVENLNEGHDLVQASVSYTLSANVEDGVLTGSAHINLTGNNLDNVLTGNSGSNVLDGGAGADIMNGGAGNDSYYVDNIGDVVIETGTSASEIDAVNASIDYTLGANVEWLNLIGSANLNGTGNSLDNRITGNSGNNILDGGLGADYMAGGTGNDTYIVDNVGDVVVETSTLASEIDTVKASITYTLGANVENLTLTGTANIDGIGNSLNNVLIGNDGNNQLNGGAGLDTMIGGKGDDAYGIDQAGELALVQENANEGNDTLAIVYTATAQNNVIDLNLSNLQNVENVSLYAAGAFTVLGNALDNVLIGNADANTLQGGAGNDVLNGGAGADALIGGTGDDTYIVDNVGDTVVENLNEGHDLVQASVSYTLSANVEDGVLTGSAHINLTGNNLDNVLTGNSGSNVLDGGAGADIMNGGAGNDSYYVDNIGDVVIETGTSASEIDAVNASIDYTLGANVEWLNLIGSANLNGTGNSLDNRITGNSGNNILDGGLGADYMAGGTGNDTYIVDNVGDVVVETSTLASEIDTVKASITYTLGANVENLTLTGTANIDGIGNSLNNVLIGNDGNNQLNGGAGLDTMIGGKGDDAYGIDQAGELALVQENANEGNDTLAIVYTATAQNNVIDLNLSNLQNVENVTVYSTGAFTLLGNAQNNVLIGNASNNVLNGGAGSDTLTGGGGADTFVFGAVNEMGLGNNRDVITDFNSLQGDKIDLTHFDANLLSAGFNGFTFIGANDFTGAGQLRFVDHVLSGNVSGNIGADFEIQLVGVNSFSANDLVA